MEPVEEDTQEGPSYLASCAVPVEDVAAVASWARHMILNLRSVRVDQSVDLPGYVEGVAW